MPDAVTKAVVALYADNPSTTDYHRFEGRGHSLTIDSRWREVATVALDWIAAQEPSLAGAQPIGQA